MKFKITFIFLLFFILITFQNCYKKRIPAEPLYLTTSTLTPTIVFTITPDIYEDDNSYSTAKTIIANDTAQYHNSHNQCDYDYLQFQAVQGMQYIIETFNLESRSDTYLYLIQRDGKTIITTDDDSGSQEKASKIIWVCEEAGWYFIRVQQYACMTIYGWGTGYNIMVTDGSPYTPTVTPTITMSHTASPVCSATFTYTISPTFTDTPFYTPTATATKTPLPVLGTGLWHEISDYDSHVPPGHPESGISPTLWWYGRDDTGNYDTGKTNAGEIFIGPFFVDYGYKLYFWSYEHTENLAGYDTRSIYASVFGMDNWIPVASLFGNEQIWYKAEFLLPFELYGQNVNFRFVFDTCDSIENTYTGWFVDDIKVGP